MNRPPIRVHLLRVLLLAQTAIVAGVWLWTWRTLQGYAWIGGGVETDLFERGMSYLVVLAPTIAVNLLAIYWLGRGGHRARLYLAAAGALAATQQILLLIPLDPGRSIAAGVAFALLVGPVAFAGAAIAMTRATKAWLRGDRAPGRTHVVSLETVVWSLTAVLAIGIAASVDRWVEAAAETSPPVGEYDESDAWSRMEEAVTNTVVGGLGFPGFERRQVEVTACGYRTESGLRTYRYHIVYEMAPFPTDTEQDAYAADVRDKWGSDDYRILAEANTSEGRPTFTARRSDELTLLLVLGEGARVEIESECLERVDEAVTCLDPQGGVPPGRDTVDGLGCEPEE